jgi:hypothetical protein
MTPVSGYDLLLLSAKSFKNYADGFQGKSKTQADQYFDQFGAYFRYASGTPFRCIGGAMSVARSAAVAWFAFAPQTLPMH